MNWTFEKPKHGYFDDIHYLWIPVPKHLYKDIQEFVKTMDKPHDVTIKPHREKRSLDANAALWKMLSLMADKLHTTKDELYLEMLDRYGVFTNIVVKPNVVDRVKQEWKTVRELGEVTINGKTGIQLQCFFGSSTYDSKEFSTLLEGVIQEGKEIGVDFISREERARMIAEWGNK
jgi:hypothetical protein